MISVTVRTNYQEHLRWVDSIDLRGEKLHRIARELAMEFERALKEILHADTKHATGATAASVESWELMVTAEHVRMAIGSRTRGHILRWLDRGRGEVRPKTVMSRHNPRFRAALKFIIEGEIFFRYSVRPSPPLFVMYRAAQIAFSKLDEIASRVQKS